MLLEVASLYRAQTGFGLAWGCVGFFGLEIRVFFESKPRNLTCKHREASCAHMVINIGPKVPVQRDPFTAYTYILMGPRRLWERDDQGTC